MKVLLVCVLVIAGAFVAKGAHELCGLSNDQLKEMLKCMGEGINSQLKGKASEIIHSQGDNVVELLKRQCDADVDFAEVLTTIFSDEEAEAIREVYRKCKPVQS